AGPSAAPGAAASGAAWACTANGSQAASAQARKGRRLRIDAPQGYEPRGCFNPPPAATVASDPCRQARATVSSAVACAHRAGTTAMTRVFFAIALLLAALPVQAACPPVGHGRGSLAALRGAGFEVAETQREALAFGLLECLGDPDPVLRDGIAYEALMHWLRADAFAPPVLRRLRD